MAITGFHDSYKQNYITSHTDFIFFLFSKEDENISMV
jgi:hypothetical protein